jgi:hypothetical protein
MEYIIVIAKLLFDGKKIVSLNGVPVYRNTIPDGVLPEKFNSDQLNVPVYSHLKTFEYDKK